MTLVNVAFLGFKAEMWTRCPEAPDHADTYFHLWAMRDEDERVSCRWCKAIAWHTWHKGQASPERCSHGRAHHGPACPLCDCHHPAGHIWQTDAAAPGVEHCRSCHACRMVHGLGS